jgi:hypothetical protein
MNPMRPKSLSDFEDVTEIIISVKSSADLYFADIFHKKVTSF